MSDLQEIEKRIIILEKRLDTELTEMYKRMTTLYDHMHMILHALMIHKQINSNLLMIKAARRDKSFLWN